MAKDVLNKHFWENIHFGREVVWYGLNLTIIHFFKASILPVFNSSFSLKISPGYQFFLNILGVLYLAKSISLGYHTLASPSPCMVSKSSRGSYCPFKPSLHPVITP